MGMFDDLAAAAGGLDVEGIAARVGIDPGQARMVLGALAAKLGGGAGDPQAAAAETAQETGVSLDTVRAMLPEVIGALGGGGTLGGLGGVAGKLGGLF